jgi:hypothetical protein
VFDRLFRLLPWAPCLVIALTVRFSPSATIAGILLSPGVREMVFLWLLPSAVVLFDLGRNDSLSDRERRQWRRHLLVDGWGVALIYLCAEDRHLPIHPAEPLAEADARTAPQR